VDLKRFRVASLALACTTFGLSVRASAAPPLDEPSVKPLLAPELRTRVERAIERGVGFVDSAQTRGGLFRGSYSASHPLGETALATLALCASGRGIEHPSVRRAIDAMQEKWRGGRREKAGVTRRARGASGGGGVTTYEVALALMALVEAYALPGSGDDRARSSSVARRSLGPLPPDVRDWIQELADWLADHKVSAPLGGIAWRYPDGGEDHSCTQYAILGLRAALEAGARVDVDLFSGALTHYLRSQERTGPKVRRLAVFEDEDRRYARQTYATGGFDRARGWGYQDTSAATPAMTAGGVSTLVVCDDACRGGRRLPSGTQKDVERGIADGIAWLGEEFEKSGRPSNGNYYYLYGLERAAVLAGVRTIGGHDWYAEGSRWLVGSQSKDGNWGTLVDTCFALLFLTRSTDPGSPLRTRPATPPSDALLDLEALARLPDRDFGPVFDRAFDVWRRGRTAVAPVPGYTAEDMAVLGPRGWRRLVHLLDDPDPRVRADAFELLTGLTGRTLGYHPEAARETRLRGIAEWLSFTQKAIEEETAPGFAAEGAGIGR